MHPYSVPHAPCHSAQPPPASRQQPTTTYIFLSHTLSAHLHQFIFLHIPHLHHTAPAMSSSSSTFRRHPTPSPLPQMICHECGLAPVETYVVKKIGINTGRRFYKCPLSDYESAAPLQVRLRWHKDYLAILQNKGLIEVPHQIQPASPPAMVARHGNSSTAAHATTNLPAAPNAINYSRIEALLTILLLVAVAHLPIDLISLITA